MKIQLLPGVPYLKIFLAINVILNHYMGHELHIGIINLENKLLELKLQVGGDNRSPAVFTSLPVCIS